LAKKFFSHEWQKTEAKVALRQDIRDPQVSELSMKPAGRELFLRSGGFSIAK
jgi:hypothetical protein